jgi:hypothetical protein
MPGPRPVALAAVPSILQAWAREHGIAGSFPELCANEEVKKAVLKQIADTGRQGGLKVRRHHAKLAGLQPLARLLFLRVLRGGIGG